MALPMTIHEAKALAADDLAVNEDTVAQAEAEAQEAASLVEALDRQAVESDKVPKATPAQALEAKQLLDFARKRLTRARLRASRAAAAKRLLALADVGQDVEQLAAAVSKPDASIEALVQRLADTHAELAQRCQDHDTAVLGLVARARQLGTEKAGPLGPLATSAHVAVVGNGISGRTGIQSGSATVLRIDKRNVSEAVQAAVTGDPARAVRILAGAKIAATPEQAPHYFMGTGGHVVPSDHPVPPALTEQIRRGILRELGDDEVQAHLAGRLHGHQAQA